MPSKITNLADISDFTDGEGNKVTDRDSKEDNVKIPEDRPGYKDDESKKIMYQDKKMMMTLKK